MKVLLVIIIIIAAYAVMQTAFTQYYSMKSKALPQKLYPLNSEYGSSKSPELRVLLAGDSIAAGVGASSPETGMAGRIGAELGKKNHVIFTNIAVSGNRMADLLNSSLPPKKQNLTILVISSNDFFHFTNPAKFESDTEAVLSRYEKNTNKIILIGPGDIGGARAIPLFMKPTYNYKRGTYVNILEKAAAKHKITYVNPKDKKHDIKAYGRIEASDGFHPNDNGHKFWADIILDSMR